jgi:hypothetical protein
MSRKPASETEKSVAQKLAGRSTGNVIEFPRPPVPTPNRLNRRELCSIKAMTAYVSHKQNVSEQTVRAIVESEFNVKDIEQLRRDDFERVIAYLVDLRCDLMTN